MTRSQRRLRAFDRIPLGTLDGWHGLFLFGDGDTRTIVAVLPCPVDLEKFARRKWGSPRSARDKELKWVVRRLVPNDLHDLAPAGPLDTESVGPDYNETTEEEAERLTGSDA